LTGYNLDKHWVCKDCLVWNSQKRTACLGCNKWRVSVEVTNQEDYDELYEQFNGKGNFVSIREKIGGENGNH